MQLKVNNIQRYQHWLKCQMTSQLYFIAKLIYIIALTCTDVQNFLAGR